MANLYFSQYGNDANDGLTEANPKKDFTRYSNVDNVTLMFKCGEVFEFDSSELNGFYVGGNVELTSYGEGEKPIISGYLQVSGTWTQESSNIYYQSLASYDQSPYTDNSAINIGSILITRYREEQPEVSFGRVYIKSLLKVDGDFFIDYSNKRLYVYSTSDPASDEYRVARPGSGFGFQQAKPNVVMNNLGITGFSRHGICGVGKNVVISNCHVYNIGGDQIYPNKTDNSDWERMGNGIEIWGHGAENVLVEKNVVENCFDAGITVQASADCTNGATGIEFRQNVVKNCYYLIEVFNHNAQNEFSEIKFHDNILLKANSLGYRQSFWACSQLCIWSQEYTGDTVKIYDNIFAYTNKYTSFAFFTADNIHCDVYGNLFATDHWEINAYGDELIRTKNRKFNLRNQSEKDYVDSRIALELVD